MKRSYSSRASSEPPGSHGITRSPTGRTIPPTRQKRSYAEVEPERAASEPPARRQRLPRDHPELPADRLPQANDTWFSALGFLAVVVPDDIPLVERAARKLVA